MSENITGFGGDAHRQALLAERRATIEAAGYTYPADWDEMGSSERDLWEEWRLHFINKKETNA